MGKVTSHIMSSDMISSKEKAKVDVNALSTRVGVVESSLADIATFTNYSTVLTKDANGNITKIELKDGTTVIQTTNITRDSSGNVTSVQDIANSKIVTTTVNRVADGSVSSVSKAVM